MAGYWHTVLLGTLALFPVALASCDPARGLGQLYCSRGFTDGKSLKDVPSVQQFSGCFKLLLSQCTTFEGLGDSCNNPACDSTYGNGDVSKLPLRLWPGRRATMCMNGCASYMPRAQLCTICKQKADEALAAYGETLSVIAYIFTSERQTILKGATPRRSLMGANQGVIRLLDPKTPGQPQASSEGSPAASSKPRQSTLPTAPQGVSVVGEVPSDDAESIMSHMAQVDMAQMDIEDVQVRASINSPVPQGDTFAKFGSVLRGVILPPAKDGVITIDQFNSFDPESPLYKPAPNSGKLFPVDKLRKYTNLLLQGDEENGLAVAYGLQVLVDKIGKSMKLLGFSISGFDPNKIPQKVAGGLVGQYADRLVEGLGGAADKLTGALYDVINKFAANSKQNREVQAAVTKGQTPPPRTAFLASPTSVLSWFVDYQQTMQCYYTCLSYVLECLEHLKKPPDCHNDCRSTKGIEAIAGTRARQIQKYSQGCK